MESKRASTITATPPSPYVEEIGEGSSAETRTVNALAKEVEEEEEESKEEVPPDGTDRTTEWREGPHKIIERRRGPGEEVRRLINIADYGVDLVHRSTSRSSTTHSSPRCKPRQDEQVMHIFTSCGTRPKKFIAAQRRSKRPQNMISML
jgi:hypothetical protein